MGLGRWTWTGIAAGFVLAVGDGVLTFGPAPDTELERHWSESLALEVDSLDETYGGNKIDLPFERIEFSEKRSFELTDALKACAGGRPTDFTRAFSTSAMEFGLVLDGKDIGSLQGAGACDGSRVHFVYRPEEERYVGERLAGELENEQLAALEPDLDLLGLLPAGELAEGATFEPELESLRSLFRAGGDLGYRAAKIQLRMDGLPAQVMIAGALGSLNELFAPGTELSGKLTGRLVGKDEEAQGQVLRLEYHLEVKLEAELGERFRSYFTEEAPTTHDLRVKAELEGELVCLWDVDARHFRSARFAGDVSLAGHLVFPVVFVEGQEPQEFVGDYELSGDAKLELVNE